MERENMRVIVSKRMMREGLLRCLESKNIDEISISELCREAQVNRATFYNHYQFPKDILVEIGWEHAKEIKKIFDANKKLPVKERLTGCFTYVFENRQAFNTLFSANADREVMDAAEDIFKWLWNKNFDFGTRLGLKDDVEKELAASVFGWAGYFLIRKWLTEDIKKTPEEITELFIKLSGRDVYK